MEHWFGSRQAFLKNMKMELIKKFSPPISHCTLKLLGTLSLVRSRYVLTKIEDLKNLVRGRVFIAKNRLAGPTKVFSPSEYISFISFHNLR